jgi:hypothetical protein
LEQVEHKEIIQHQQMVVMEVTQVFQQLPLMVEEVVVEVDKTVLEMQVDQVVEEQVLQDLMLEVQETHHQFHHHKEILVEQENVVLMVVEVEEEQLLRAGTLQIQEIQLLRLKELVQLHLLMEHQQLLLEVEVVVVGQLQLQLLMQEVLEVVVQVLLDHTQVQLMRLLELQTLVVEAEVLSVVQIQMVEQEEVDQMFLSLVVKL